MKDKCDNEHVLILNSILLNEYGLIRR